MLQRCGTCRWSSNWETMSTVAQTYRTIMDQSCKPYPYGSILKTMSSPWRPRHPDTWNDPVSKINGAHFKNQRVPISNNDGSWNDPRPRRYKIRSTTHWLLKPSLVASPGLRYGKDPVAKLDHMPAVGLWNALCFKWKSDLSTWVPWNLKRPPFQKSTGLVSSVIRC
jgi:hypothetical protein